MKIFILLWTILVFASVAWYGILLFFIGFKGGKEISQMMKTLGDRNTEADKRKE